MPIKISKAIEILNLRVASPFYRANPDTRESTKLGIEGLKAIRDFRQGLVVDFELPLPGEEPEEIAK